MPPTTRERFEEKFGEVFGEYRREYGKYGVLGEKDFEEEVLSFIDSEIASAVEREREGTRRKWRSLLKTRNGTAQRLIDIVGTFDLLLSPKVEDK